MMSAHPRRRALGLCAVVLLSAVAWTIVAAPAWAGDERVRLVELTQENGRIMVSAVLDPGFSPQTEDDIRNGISKDLYYYVVLKRRQRIWFDEEKAAATIKYGIKFNLLKQEYTVSARLPSGTTQTVFADFESAKRFVSRIERIPVASVRELQANKAHLVSVKAEMRAPRLPLYLDYFLFFIPFLEIDTPWADSPVFHPPHAP